MATARHFLSEKRQPIVDCLTEDLAFPLEEARFLVDIGAVYVNKIRLTEERPIDPGDYIRVHPEPRRFEVKAISWWEQVVLETGQYLILHKPSGVPTHPTLDNYRENALYELQAMLGVPLWVTQRLDQLTEGLILYAKQPEYQRAFNAALEKRRVQKRYLALTERGLEPGEKIHFMEPSPYAPKRIAPVPETPRWKRCVLTVYSSVPRGPFWENEIELLTGRTHQIRAQCAALGAPVLGDPIYGKSIGNTLKLCATQLDIPSLLGEPARHFTTTPSWKTGSPG